MFSLSKLPRNRLLKSLKQSNWKENFIIEKAKIDRVLDPVTGEVYPYNKMIFSPHTLRINKIKSKEARSIIRDIFKNK
jgi:hypothetical protein